MKILQFIRRIDREIAEQLEAERARFVRELLASYEPFRPTVPDGAALN